MFGFGSSSNSTTSAQEQQRRLLASVFQGSIDNILLESTKHRGMSALRDAAHTTRSKNYPPQELFHTLAFACEVCGTRKSCRNILNQSISDLGKLFSLSLLPVSGSVSQTVCDVVRRLSLQPAQPDIALSAAQQHTEDFLASSQSASKMAAVSAVSRSESPHPEDGASPPRSTGASRGTVDSSNNNKVILVNDEELLLRLLQLLATVIAACPLGSAGLAEPLGLIFLFFTGSAPGSLLEETCTATLMGRVQLYCAALVSANDGEAAESPSSSGLLTPQLHAVYFFKDLCAMAAGRPPKWVKLTLSTAARQRDWMVVPGARQQAQQQQQQPPPQQQEKQSGSGSETAMHSPKIGPNRTVNQLATTTSLRSAEPMTAAASPPTNAPIESAAGTTVVSTLAEIPHRLRVLILRLLLSYFSEVPLGDFSSSSLLHRSGNRDSGSRFSVSSSERQQQSGSNILFSQCLNEDIISLALSSTHPWFAEKSDGAALKNFANSFGDTEQLREYEKAFVLSQKLALLALSKFGIMMRNNANQLVYYHATLLHRARAAHAQAISSKNPAQRAYMHAMCESLTQCLSALLVMWRKAIGDDNLLGIILSLSGHSRKRSSHHQDLSTSIEYVENDTDATGDDDLLRQQQEQLPAFVVFVSQSSEFARELLKQIDDTEKQQQQQQATISIPRASSTASHMHADIENDTTNKSVTDVSLGNEEPSESEKNDALAGDGTPSEDTNINADGSGAAQGSRSKDNSRVSEEREGPASQQKKQHGISPRKRKVSSSSSALRHASSEYLRDSLAFLSMLGQSCARLVEAAAAASGGSNDSIRGSAFTPQDSPSSLIAELRHVYLALHPALLYVIELALEHLQEEEGLHVVLMLTTHWTHVSCALHLADERGALLRVLISALYRQDSRDQAIVEAIIMSRRRLQSASDPKKGDGASASSAAFGERSVSNKDSHGKSSEESQLFGRVMHNMRKFAGGIGGNRASSTAREATTSATASGTTSQQPAGEGSAAAAAAATTHGSSAAASAGRRKALKASLHYEQQQATLRLVDRLQHKFFILKSLFAMAKSLGEWLGNSWVSLAQGFALIEPLIYQLQMCIFSITDASGIEREKQQKQLLSDAQHMRDAMRSLCVESAETFSDEAYSFCMSAVVEHTLLLSDKMVSSYQRRALAYKGAEQNVNFHDDGLNACGCLWQWALLSEGLSLAYLSVMPIHAERAALTWQLLMRLYNYATQTSRIQTWSRCLKVCPLASGCSPEMRAESGGGGRGVLHAESRVPFIASNAQGSDTSGYDSKALVAPELAELYESLALLAENVAVTAAFIGVQRGRLESFLASRREQQSTNSNRDGMSILTGILKAQIPSGPFAQSRFGRVAANVLASCTVLYSGSVDGPSPRPSPLTSSPCMSSNFGTQQPDTPFTQLDGLSDDALCTLVQKNVDDAGALPFALLTDMYITHLNLCLLPEEPLSSSLAPTRRSSPVPENGDSDNRIGNDGDSSWANSGTVRAAHMTLSVAVLYHILRQAFHLIHGYGEDIRGASWDSLMSLLQRTVGVNTDAPAPSQIAHVGHSPASSSFTSSSGAAMRAVDAQRAALPDDVMRTAPWNEAVQLAFRALELVQHNCITHMDGRAIRELIQTAAAFVSYRGAETSSKEEKRLHMNLSAVQLLWSIADYLATAPALAGTRSAQAERKSTDHYQSDWLWCFLLLQLQKYGCMDTRHEVRQSALKSLYSLVQTYGTLLSADCWQCILQSVLAPQMAAVLDAQRASCVNASAMDRSGEVGGSMHSPIQGSDDGDALVQARLKQSLQDHPKHLNEMRITITDAASRVFISHYVTITNIMNESRTHTAAVAETLNQFIHFCAAAKIVVGESTGEDSALSAVHALHGMLVGIQGAAFLHPHDHYLAWEALEGFLMHRGGEPPEVVRKQCSLAVVSALVSALCDDFCFSRQRDSSTDGNPAVAMSVEPRGLVRTASMIKMKRRPELNRLFRLLAASAACDAVADAYYFPNKAQTTLTECMTAMWPFMSMSERHALVTTVVLPQFPEMSKVQLYVTQLQTPIDPDDSSNGNRRSPAPGIALRTVLPPGAHPHMLLHWMEWLQNIPLNAAVSSSAGAIANELGLMLAPVVVTYLGRLLSLQYASAASAALTVPGTPFSIPQNFYDKCFELLLYTVWQVVLQSDASAAAPSPSAAASSAATTVLSQRRREAILALSNVFTHLLSLAMTVVSPHEAASSLEQEQRSTVSSPVILLPDALHDALQTLERLVMCLGEVVQRLASKEVNDINSATDIITALTAASSADSPSLASVSQRSLITLRQWSAHPTASGESSAAAPVTDEPHHRIPQQQGPGHTDGNNHHRLQGVVRTSMNTRSKAVLQQYIGDPTNITTADHLLDVLTDIRATCKRILDEGQSDDGEEEVMHVKEVLPDIIQLVSCVDGRQSRSAADVEREKSLRKALGEALAAIHSLELF